MMKNKKAFSLVELSIVLIIIALFSVVVLGGERILFQTKLKNIVAQVEEVRVAVTIFRNEYNYYPGDLTPSFWAGVGNGNGDGYIDANGPRADSGSEHPLAWLHLQSAELILGNYAGNLTGGLQPGVNVLKSPYSDDTMGVLSSWDLWGRKKVEIALELIRYPAVNIASNYSNSPQVPVMDAYFIDKKFDDGKPYLGHVIGYQHDSGNADCTGTHIYSITADAIDYTGYDAYNYDVDDTNALCNLRFSLE